MITKKDILDFCETYRIITYDEDYIYLLPHIELRKWISNYTITFLNEVKISDNYTIIPHGSATLVFSCDSKGIHSDLFGASSMPSMIGKQANQFDMLLIIEFHPSGLSAFIDAMHYDY